jgi:hypothetical protein
MGGGQCNDTHERVFFAGVADFAADFMVKLRHSSHATYCTLFRSALP